MQLIEIDKIRYRKHLNVVFAAIAAALITITLISSTLYIQLFSTAEASHFLHNLAGVFTAAAITAFILIKLRSHPYLTEVVYIWDLKQQLNRISRKQRKIEAAVENGNPDAMIILNFQYRGSKQLYQMDDNTITLTELNARSRLLEEKMQASGMDTSTDNFDPALLDNF